MTDPNCRRCRELAPELALGVLPAQDRATVLAHLEDCPDCVEQLRSLTEIGDGLLELVPGVEPPVGFEDRVLHRLGHRGTGGAGGHRWRRPRWLPMTLAAAVAAVAFGIGGWALGGHAGLGTAQAGTSGASASSPASGQAVLRTAALVGPGDRQLGEVFAYTRPGQRPTVYMAMDTSGVSGTVSCQLERADGGFVQVGSFAVRGGYGSWTAPIGVDPGTLVGARLVSDTGAVLATGMFSY